MLRPLHRLALGAGVVLLSFAGPLVQVSALTRACACVELPRQRPRPVPVADLKLTPDGYLLITRNGTVYRVVPDGGGDVDVVSDTDSVPGTITETPQGFTISTQIAQDTVTITVEVDQATGTAHFTGQVTPTTPGVATTITVTVDLAVVDVNTVAIAHTVTEDGRITAKGLEVVAPSEVPALVDDYGRIDLAPDLALDQVDPAPADQAPADAQADPAQADPAQADPADAAPGEAPGDAAPGDAAPGEAPGAAPGADAGADGGAGAAGGDAGAGGDGGAGAGGDGAGGDGGGY